MLSKSRLILRLNRLLRETPHRQFCDVDNWDPKVRNDSGPADPSLQHAGRQFNRKKFEILF